MMKSASSELEAGARTAQAYKKVAKRVQTRAVRKRSRIKYASYLETVVPPPFFSERKMHSAATRGIVRHCASKVKKFHG